MVRRVERHEAIVAGAGPAGLAAAAMLRKHGFETLVLECTENVGARWRTRYDGLRLNTMRTFSTLPGLRMGLRAGRYPSRDDFVAYLERYASHHELQIRFGTSLERVEHGEGDDWRLLASGDEFRARYVVVATGWDAVPRLPPWAHDRDGFPGEVVHAAEVRSPAAYAGKDVLVVGANNTGIDLAGFLDAAGARVVVSMRTPPNLFKRDIFGMPGQPTAVLLERLPSSVGDAVGRFAQWVTFGDLSSHGIPRAPEGMITKFRTQLVGPAVDDGFVHALKAGRTRIAAAAARFDGEDVVLADGERLRPDAVICATGYERGLEEMVGHLGVLRPDGVPTYHDGAPCHPAAPRLYFAGFWSGPAGQIRLMPTHARRIARAAVRDRANMAACPPQSPARSTVSASSS